MRLVLWDIDGTLVDSAGYGRDAFGEAFREVFGRPAPGAGTVVMAGRTDHEIALEVFRQGRVDDGERRLDEFSDALARALAAKEPLIRAEGRALPGAREALSALAREEGVLQSLLTGNIEPNAAVKLAAFGLERFLDFEIGAFGSDDRHRPSLVAIAREKARLKHGVGVRPEDAVLVGDTPLDVAAGLQGGARVVAVATGPHTGDELRAAGAHSVLPDLVDTGAAVAAILGR